MGNDFRGKKERNPTSLNADLNIQDAPLQARRVGQMRLTQSGSTSQGGKTGAGKKQGPASADPTIQGS
jgi:hypothetical protein